MCAQNWLTTWHAVHSHAQQLSLTLICISLSVWCLSVLRGTWASSPLQMQEFGAGTGRFNLTCVCEWMFVSVINSLPVQDLSRFLPRRQRRICPPTPPPTHDPVSLNCLVDGWVDGWINVCRWRKMWWAWIYCSPTHPFKHCTAISHHLSAFSTMHRHMHADICIRTACSLGCKCYDSYAS